MNNGIVALIAIGSCLVYAFGAGVTWAMFKHRGHDMEMPGPWFGAGLWPLTLPTMLAARMAERWLAPKPPRATARVKERTEVRR